MNEQDQKTSTKPQPEAQANDTAKPSGNSCCSVASSEACCEYWGQIQAAFKKAFHICTNPNTVWSELKQEQVTTWGLYQNFIFIVAAVPPVATFLSKLFLGRAFVASLLESLVSYAVSLVMLLVLAQLVEMIVPKFKGTGDSVASLKLLAYSSSAHWLGSIFSLIPQLSIIVLLFGFYSLYLLYEGCVIAGY